MKSFNKFLNGIRGNIDSNEIESYYGHGAQMHKHQDHSHEGGNKPRNAVKYSCPMKCEGNKTYDHPGNCPVCNMKLVPLNNV